MAKNKEMYSLILLFSFLLWISGTRAAVEMHGMSIGETRFLKASENLPLLSQQEIQSVFFCNELPTSLAVRYFTS